ncbi:MAG: helix-turn-helix domain-containing protein [Bacteroidia bacterium]|nr:helix-turn-helix domain-containing protein [Bacteroidia bacterium]MDW3647646.1 helix-turn-helix domain-containing protein [Bacteroidia bacterium]
MDKALKDKIEEFKSYRIDKPPLEIIEHYRKELQAIQDTMEIVQGRWKMPIIALLCNGEFRYSELEKGIPKITPRMLSKELKDLEINELVKRKVYDTIPVKVTYKLTDYGYTLVPLIIELTNWGKQHREYLMKEKRREHNKG